MSCVKRNIANMDKKKYNRRNNKRRRTNRNIRQWCDNADSQSQTVKNASNAAANQANTKIKTETKKLFTKEMLKDALVGINEADKSELGSKVSKTLLAQLITGNGCVSSSEEESGTDETGDSSSITDLSVFSDTSSEFVNLCETNKPDRFGIFSTNFQSRQTEASKEQAIGKSIDGFEGKSTTTSQNLAELTDWLSEEFCRIALNTNFIKNGSSKPELSTDSPKATSTMPAAAAYAQRDKPSGYKAPKPYYMSALQVPTADAELSSGSDCEYDSEDYNNEHNSAEEQNESPTYSDAEYLKAVPAYAVTDAICAMGKPSNTMTCGDKIEQLTIEKNRIIDKINKINITQVYTPFQFWFHFVNGDYNTIMLELLCSDLNGFYNRMPAEKWQVHRFYFKKDYICVALHCSHWYRVRILLPPIADRLKVFFVDFGYVLHVRTQNLRYMNKDFAQLPGFALRGCLSHVHPLGLHWHKRDIDFFKKMVYAGELYAITVDVDLSHSVYTMKLGRHSQLLSSINQLLIDKDIAGESDHFSKDSRLANHGRRLRYLRERLPTFEMLESGVFPLRGKAKVEDEFDDIIYTPEFYKEFKSPQRSDPVRIKLYDALDDWLEDFEQEEQSWRQHSPQ